jgi:2-hydroxy-6-oxonona-2,4-dienedioate hydrolase
VSAPATDGTGSFWLAAGACHRLAVYRADIDGVVTRIVEAGDPRHPPVVCIHGTGGHAEAFIHNLGALSRHRRIVAFDLPAHGWSSAPERSYEIDGYCRHLESLLDHLSIRSTALVGQSLGGWIALWFAVTRADRVERMVLVGAGGNTFDPAVMARLTTSSMEAVRNPTATTVRDRLQVILNRRVEPTDEIVACRLAVYSRPAAVDAMQKSLALQVPEIRRRNIFTEWSSVRQPTLLVWGRGDTVTPLAAGKEMAASLPNAELAVFDNCGHWPQFEEPASFNELVQRFLE